MRTKRLYSLFALRNGKWEKLSPNAYTKETAIRVFQSALLAPLLGNVPYEKRELRPIKQS